MTITTENWRDQYMQFSVRLLILCNITFYCSFNPFQDEPLQHEKTRPAYRKLVMLTSVNWDPKNYGKPDPTPELRMASMFWTVEREEVNNELYLKPNNGRDPHFPLIIRARSVNQLLVNYNRFALICRNICDPFNQGWNPRITIWKNLSLKSQPMYEKSRQSYMWCMDTMRAEKLNLLILLIFTASAAVLNQSDWNSIILYASAKLKVVNNGIKTVLSIAGNSSYSRYSAGNLTLKNTFSLQIIFVKIDSTSRIFADHQQFFLFHTVFLTQIASSLTEEE